MSKQVRLRRGTTAQHSSFTGAQGEVTVDTDKKVVVVHDGSTAGGVPMFPSTGGTVSGAIRATKLSVGDNTDYDLNIKNAASSSSSANMHLLSGNIAASGVYFSDTDANAMGRVQYEHATDTLKLFSGGATRFTQTTSLTSIDNPLNVGGKCSPSADNTYSSGDGSFRWSTIYAATGTINTSDKREKTPLRKLNSQEIACGLELAQTGCGVFQWLNSVEEKGADNARLHIGYTVQDVIAVMRKHNLDPFRYAFICYDQWGDKFVEHPAVEADPENGIEAREAFTEQVQFAGDRYGFRADQLDRFINAAVIQFFLSGGKL